MRQPADTRFHPAPPRAADAHGPTILPPVDRTLPLLLHGYAWLPEQLRRHDGPALRTRLPRRPAVALHGPEAVRFFYDERHIHRAGVLPEPVRSTLFGHGAVHGLDGPEHQLREAMFLGLLADPHRVDQLVDSVGAAWDQSVPLWRERGRIVLLDAVADVLTAGVARWAGLTLRDDEVPTPARDLVAMVDGFATLGPRHWRARLAHRRRERELAGLIEAVRDGSIDVPAGSAVQTVAQHRDADGAPLNPRVAAMELLNILRPTVAVCWFAAFAAHALHRWPDNRERLAKDDPGFATAFAQEVRRFYPFAPFVAGRAATDLTFAGEPIPAGTMVLLDLYGHQHDPALWGDPYAFRPQRFLDTPLIPQGGDPATGHRCPGEAIVVGLLELLAPRLARLDYTVPDRDLAIPLSRVIARPDSGFVIVLA
ncbi:cytochrome P450 [Kitasatospora sp. NPDC098663]|uniref:cytochrome P450 n=1 Tax=Kitasatospora sp. NPDC098663 TaxID=3364096 RepID=UPI0038045882